MLVEIIEVHDSVAVGAGCDIDHAGVEGRRGGSEENRTQKLEEKEVREVVGAELDFESVFCFAFGWIANSFSSEFKISMLTKEGRTSIVHKNIELVAFLQELFNASTNRSERT